MGTPRSPGYGASRALFSVRDKQQAIQKYDNVHDYLFRVDQPFWVGEDGVEKHHGIAARKNQKKVHGANFQKVNGDVRKKKPYYWASDQLQTYGFNSNTAFWAGSLRQGFYTNAVEEPKSKATSRASSARGGSECGSSIRHAALSTPPRNSSTFSAGYGEYAPVPNSAPKSGRPQSAHPAGGRGGVTVEHFLDTEYRAIEAQRRQLLDERQRLAKSHDSLEMKHQAVATARMVLQAEAEALLVAKRELDAERLEVQTEGPRVEEEFRRVKEERLQVRAMLEAFASEREKLAAERAALESEATRLHAMMAG
mmetsp:Transcript_17001/g.54093  ORF Transcript_17001/g.54093 Transcript_17001/m.54093 type:complete len:310 (-) Transcript_17001:925-1854(-)